ncbi:MAG TPA: DUF1223 domain-containing protein [Burkholderiales bacterium]|nr:DUF1223 domain-containing protein [Burkholderiales bacterium]
MKPLLAAFAAALLFPQAVAAECAASSPATTTALVELYTSEGCSSCPPADRWLSSLKSRGYTPERVVPIELHVDYWDYIGWKDPYAQARFSSRQRKLAQLTHGAFVYTPQVLLQGRDFRRWDSSVFDAEVKRINAQPARARIALALHPGGKDAFEVDVRAQVVDAAQRAEAALYLGTYANRLRSDVRAGENGGRTLKHDFVVLEWLGPIGFDGRTELAERRRIALLPEAVPADSGVVAFVQNRASAEVLQALMLPACPG